MSLSPILFGIVSALGWGTTDYLGALSTRKVGVFRTALLTQGIGAVLILILSMGSLTLITQYPEVSLAAFGLGLLNTIIVLSVYKSFEVGKLSIVSPMTSSFPALSTLLAVLLLNEVVTQLRGLGILLTLGGIILVTMQSGTGRFAGSTGGERRLLGKGTEYALVAFVGLGLLYFALKVVVASLGVFIPVLLMRLGMGSAMGVILAIARSSWKATNADSRISSVLGLGIMIAILDLVGGIAYNFGVQGGEVSVVSTISGCYSIVTVVLAGIFLRERLRLAQWGGVLTIVVGVAILGLAG